MPHLHLSMQSGDDMILKRMKRRHLAADAIRFCEKARRLRPDIVFGADLIAGFPTETEEMFANTERIVDDCGLTYLHVFPFSPAQRHAGGPHAASAEVRDQGPRGAVARQGQRGSGRISSSAQRPRSRDSDREPWPRPHTAVRRIRGAGHRARGIDPARTRRPDTTAAACRAR